MTKTTKPRISVFMVEDSTTVTPELIKSMQNALDTLDRIDNGYLLNVASGADTSKKATLRSDSFTKLLLTFVDEEKGDVRIDIYNPEITVLPNIHDDDSVVMLPRTVGRQLLEKADGWSPDTFIKKDTYLVYNGKNAFSIKLAKKNTPYPHVGEETIMTFRSKEFAQKLSNALDLKGFSLEKIKSVE